MKKSDASQGQSASELISKRIAELGDWRGETLGRMRKLIKEADPDVVEEWKWMGTPVWSHDGIICTGETYKQVVKLTFARGASLPDPSRLFNASLEGGTRRAIDIREGSFQFNEICKRDGCAGVGFSQVNPTRIEERGQQRLDKWRWKNQDKMPTLEAVEGFRPYGVSDLAWCTAAGIQAKDLQFLFRPNRYLLREGCQVDDNRMEITRPKNNFGAGTAATMAFGVLTAICLVAGYILVGSSWLIIKTEGALQRAVLEQLVASEAHVALRHLDKRLRERLAARERPGDRRGEGRAGVPERLGRAGWRARRWQAPRRRPD